MTDSMGPGKLVRHMQDPSYTYDEYLICIGLGPSISSVICENPSYSSHHIQVHLYSHSPLWVHIGAGSWSRGFVSQIFLRLIFSETSISQGQKPQKSAYKVFRQIFYSSLKLRLSKFQRTTQNMTFI